MKLAVDWERRRRRKREVAERAAEPNHMYAYCRVIGCGKPARAGTSDGLDTRFCRSHAEHLQRHGSAFKRSYTAAELTPYRRAALEWLEANPDLHWVKNAVQRVEALYQQAGAHVEAFRLRGLDPRERAWKHWARLRKAEVDPRRVVAAWLAVEMIIAADPQPVRTAEFKRVQAAKLVHRMASGTHRRWERERPATSGPAVMVVEERHWYPRSRGRVLRYVGEDLEGAAELLVEHHLKNR
ncbi:hypothetical protein K678_09903 [Magnetospirillum fulvum MGU-K5]|uniref:Uncharacterized protein n=1 Tax=Magnetospirillum fulvum MGU-K5 TaxID=1316936 RepID=S9SAB5_MAGFU|nr:hypothetical protein K678_09903 [Magnetospirillum fulvum MGU-K5]